MTGFVLIAIGLTLLALVIVIPALIRNVPRQEIERREQNIAIARERLDGLKLALEEGSLSQQQFEQERRDLEAGLLDDIEFTESTEHSARPHRWMAILVLIALPALSVGLYSHLGTPSAFDPEAHRASAPDGAQLTIEKWLPSSSNDSKRIRKT